MVRTQFRHIEKKDREADGYDYVFESMDRRVWVGMTNGTNGVASYEDAVAELSCIYLPWRVGEYPGARPLVASDSLAEKSGTMRCVNAEIDLEDVFDRIEELKKL